MQLFAERYLIACVFFIGYPQFRSRGRAVIFGKTGIYMFCIFGSRRTPYTRAIPFGYKINIRNYNAKADCKNYYESGHVLESFLECNSLVFRKPFL